MITRTVLTGCVLLVSSYAFAADLSSDESSQLKFQQETVAQYQARVKADDTPVVLQAMR